MSHEFDSRSVHRKVYKVQLLISLMRKESKNVTPEICIICGREFTHLKRKVFSKITGYKLKQRPKTSVTCSHLCSRRYLIGKDKKCVSI